MNWLDYRLRVLLNVTRTYSIVCLLKLNTTLHLFVIYQTSVYSVIQQLMCQSARAE